MDQGQYEGKSSCPALLANTIVLLFEKDLLMKMDPKVEFYDFLMLLWQQQHHVLDHMLVPNDWDSCRIEG